MRVILEVISGPAAGQKVRLVADQELSVGRTEWSDFPVPQDGRMSSVHFALRNEASGCYLTDLDSSNGTLVNGQLAESQIRLSGGDEIEAGETRFRVHVERESPDAPEDQAAAGAPPVGNSPAGMDEQQAAAGDARFSTESCTSGLTLCRGHVEQLPPAEVAERLARDAALYLMVDFRKLGGSPPEDLAEHVYLFSWLPPEAAEVASPLIIAAQETQQWKTLIGEAWGNDAIVCLFSHRDPPSLVGHLRDTARVKAKQGDSSGGVLGFCWPSVMAMLLAYSQPPLLQRLLEGIEAVLVELPDLPDTWQLYGASGVAERLRKAGLTAEDGESA